MNISVDEISVRDQRASIRYVFLVPLKENVLRECLSTAPFAFCIRREVKRPEKKKREEEGEEETGTSEHAKEGVKHRASEISAILQKHPKYSQLTESMVIAHRKRSSRETCEATQEDGGESAMRETVSLLPQAPMLQQARLSAPALRVFRELPSSLQLLKISTFHWSDLETLSLPRVSTLVLANLVWEENGGHRQFTTDLKSKWPNLRSLVLDDMTWPSGCPRHTDRLIGLNLGNIKYFEWNSLMINEQLRCMSFESVNSLRHLRLTGIQWDFILPHEFPHLDTLWVDNSSLRFIARMLQRTAALRALAIEFDEIHDPMLRQTATTRTEREEIEQYLVEIQDQVSCNRALRNAKLPKSWKRFLDDLPPKLHVRWSESVCSRPNVTWPSF